MGAGGERCYIASPPFFFDQLSIFSSMPNPRLGIVLDVRGTILSPTHDHPLNPGIAHAIAALRARGIPVALVTGSGRQTMERWVVPPLINALSEANGADGVLIYTDHGAAGYRLHHSGELQPLEGYPERVLSLPVLEQLEAELLAFREAGAPVQTWETKVGQLNCEFAAPWAHRLELGATLQRQLRRSGLSGLSVSVPSAKDRIDISVSDKGRAVTDMVARTGVRTAALWLVGDSLQPGGSDAPMLEGARGARAVQVGPIPPGPGITHIPGDGPTRTAELLTALLAASDGRHVPPPARLLLPPFGPTHARADQRLITKDYALSHR
jgi:phosphoserine phosphatase